MIRNVTGNGTYSLSGDELTSNGAFFNLEVDGFDTSAFQGEVSVIIEKLTDTQLIIVQDTEDKTTQTIGGATSTSVAKIQARSVWTRQ